MMHMYGIKYLYVIDICYILSDENHGSSHGKYFV